MLCELYPGRWNTKLRSADTWNSLVEHRSPLRSIYGASLPRAPLHYTPDPVVDLYETQRFGLIRVAN